MATDAERTAGPTAAVLPSHPHARESASPWGRRLLIAAVLIWFAMLILIPGLALTRKAFEKGAQNFAKKIIANFKDYEFYTGENMNPDGMVALLNYREDGITRTSPPVAVYRLRHANNHDV